MKKFLVVLFIISTSLMLKAQTPNKGPLDGKTYTVSITEEGKKKPFDPDDLKFQTGKFKSSLFVDWGYAKAGKYEITESDSANASGASISWQAELVNDQEEKLIWSGTITADEIEGTIEQINKKGVKKKSYNFVGKQKKKPGQK